MDNGFLAKVGRTDSQRIRMLLRLRFCGEPLAGVDDDFQGFGLQINGIRFVAGAEVENAALRDFPETPAAEV